MTAITSIKGIGPSSARLLQENGFSSLKDIAEASIEKLQTIPGFGAIRAGLIIEEAIRLLKEQNAGSPSSPSPSPAQTAPHVSTSVPEKDKKKKKGKKKKKDKKEDKKKDKKQTPKKKKEKKSKKDSGKKKKKK